jgi:hypothetical protein
MPKNINALKNKDILMNSFRKGQYIIKKRILECDENIAE